MKIEEILAKSVINNIPEGWCHHCRKPISNYRKGMKFCSETCRYNHYHFGLTKPKYMNHKYMNIYLGEGVEKGAGRRCCGVVKGSMAAYTSKWSDPVPLTNQNIQKSICNDMYGIFLCNGTRLKKEEAIMLAEYLGKLNV